MSNNYEKPIYQSKKFWAMSFATIIAVVGIVAGLPVKEIMVIISPMMTYALAQGLADFGKNKK